MITREEIRSIPGLYKSIRRDLEQLHYLQEKATSVSSGISEGERVQTSRDNTAGKYIDAAADLRKDVARKQTDLTALQEKAAVFIETVEDPVVRKVLVYRYIRCYTWEDAAELMGYDSRYLRRMEAKIVLALPGPHSTAV